MDQESAKSKYGFWLYCLNKCRCSYIRQESDIKRIPNRDRRFPNARTFHEGQAEMRKQDRDEAGRVVAEASHGKRIRIVLGKDV